LTACWLIQETGRPDWQERALKADHQGRGGASAASRDGRTPGPTHWTGYDDKILSLFARGMTVRVIQGHLEEMYGTEVSPTLISSCRIEEPRHVPERRGTADTFLSGAQKHQQEVDDADSGLEGSAHPVYHPV